jgi:hypothetical protein
MQRISFKNVSEFQWPENAEVPPHRVSSVVQELQNLRSKLDSVEQQLQSVHNIANPQAPMGDTNLEWLKVTMTRAKNARDQPLVRSDPLY